MSVTQNVCGCGSTPTDAAPVSQPCRCGCCDSPAPTKEQRIAELRLLRADLDKELAALENG